MKIFLIVLALLLALVIGAMAYFGAFAKVTVTEKTMPAMTIVYAKHIGDYSKIKPVMDSVYFTLLKKEKIAAGRGFGLYYDNPRDVVKEKLRSLGGCILEAQDEHKADSLRQKGYKVAVLAPTKALYAQFSYKGPLSIIMGVFKVYPAMMKYQSGKKITPCPVMEIYNNTRKKIEYIAGYETTMATYLGLLK
jgi:DNA gyrase inhibitor GyrI